MKRGKVIIRADGNSNIGLGHLIRCIALAQMLKSDFSIQFVSKEAPLDIINDIHDKGIGFKKIDEEKEFLSVLSGDEIVVLDHYNLDSNYQKEIKSHGCKLVCIDDLHDKEFFADLIINHAPGIKPNTYRAQPYTQFALGLDYVLLRPPFLHNKDHNQIKKNRNTVFVCFGGADNKNITQLVVDILKIDARFKKIILVLGAAYQYLDILKKTIKDDIRIKLYHSISAEKIGDLMRTAELAIVPASGILQETLAVGVKVISAMYVENQKRLFNGYKCLGAFESAGKFSKEAIIKAINKFYSADFLLNTKLIDGKSGDRLLKCFKQLYIEDQILIREAKESDLLKTFEWANNSEIRKFFFTNEPIKFQVHQKWFLNKLSNQSCVYFLGEINHNIFGSVRFDIEGSIANISYLIDTSYQNKGLGVPFLKKSVDQFLLYSNKNILNIQGKVLLENIASAKIFQRLGYLMKTDVKNKVFKFRKLV